MYMQLVQLEHLMVQQQRPLGSSNPRPPILPDWAKRQPFGTQESAILLLRTCRWGGGGWSALPEATDQTAKAPGVAALIVIIITDLLNTGLYLGQRNTQLCP